MCEIWHRFQHRSFLSSRRITTKDSHWMRRWYSSVLSKFGRDRSTRLWGVEFGKFERFWITQPGVVRLRSNLLQTMTTWHQIYHKLSRSKVKVVAWYGVLASKIVTFHQLIAWLSVNFVQTIPEHSATLSLIHIWRCRRSTLCRSRWSPYH